MKAQSTKFMLCIIDLDNGMNKLKMHIEKQKDVVDPSVLLDYKDVIQEYELAIKLLTILN